MKNTILAMLKDSDWTLIKDQDNIKMMQFQNGRRKVNIYWGTMTVVDNMYQPTVVKSADLEYLRFKMNLKKENWLQKLIKRFI